ncbi:MAG: hypothetical protein V5A44_04800 [Haloarculaceae archaeon]
MSHQEDRMRPTDTVILEHLSERGIDYPEVIAAKRAFGPDRASRRAEDLADRGLVEPVSREVVYRITERGEARLDATEGVGVAASDD